MTDERTKAVAEAVTSAAGRLGSVVDVVENKAPIAVVGSVAVAAMLIALEDGGSAAP